MTDDAFHIKMLLTLLVVIAALALFWFVCWTVAGPTYHRITVEGVECIGSVSGPAGVSCDWPDQ